MKMNKKYFFITFEGIDGCGKDTQLHRLVEKIREDDNYPFGNKYDSVWITREPTNITDSGRLISKKLREDNFSKEEAVELYLQDRIEHSKIISNFLSFSHVCCSRYDLSTFAYQMTQGADFEELYLKHKFGQEDGSLIPDITIVFKIDEQTAYDRINKRGETKEFFEKRDFQKKLVENLNYCILELKKRNRNIIEISALNSIDEISKEMFEKINLVLSQNKI